MSKMDVAERRVEVEGKASGGKHEAEGEAREGRECGSFTLAERRKAPENIGQGGNPREQKARVRVNAITLFSMRAYFSVDYHASVHSYPNSLRQVSRVR